MEFKDVLAREHATRKFTDQRVSEKLYVRLSKKHKEHHLYLIRSLGAFMLLKVK